MVALELASQALATAQAVAAAVVAQTPTAPANQLYQLVTEAYAPFL